MFESYQLRPLSIHLKVYSPLVTLKSILTLYLTCCTTLLTIKAIDSRAKIIYRQVRLQHNKTNKNTTNLRLKGELRNRKGVYIFLCGKEKVENTLPYMYNCQQNTHINKKWFKVLIQKYKKKHPVPIKVGGFWPRS